MSSLGSGYSLMVMEKMKSFRFDTVYTNRLIFLEMFENLCFNSINSIDKQLKDLFRELTDDRVINVRIKIALICKRCMKNLRLIEFMTEITKILESQKEPEIDRILAQLS